MSNLLYEDMIRAETSKHACRIWREGNDHFLKNDQLKELALEKLLEGVSIHVVATELVLQDGVNSVEIIYKDTGDGVCVHKDWP